MSSRAAKRQLATALFLRCHEPSARKTCKPRPRRVRRVEARHINGWKDPLKEGSWSKVVIYICQEAQNAFIQDHTFSSKTTPCSCPCPFDFQHSVIQCHIRTFRLGETKNFKDFGCNWTEKLFSVYSFTKDKRRRGLGDALLDAAPYFIIASCYETRRGP